MMRLAFLASNNGSSFRAVVAAIGEGALAAEAVLAVSNRKEAPALDFARLHGIPTLFIPTLADPDGADTRLAAALAQARADLVILSGYLRKLGPKTLTAYDGRILNIHPALLPRHGLAPVPMRGRRNEPAFLPYILAALADIRSWTSEETEERTEAAFFALFTKVPRP